MTKYPGVVLNPAVQVSVTGVATTLLAALPPGTARAGLTLRSLTTNTQSVFVGASGVTLVTGMELKPGETMSFLGGEGPVNLVQAIATSGTQVIIVQDLI